MNAMNEKLQSVDKIGIDDNGSLLPASPILTPKGFDPNTSLLPSGGIALLAGETGVGKTALALHLALKTAAQPDGARTLVGCGLIGKGGPVLYVTTDLAPQMISARLNTLVKLASHIKNPPAGEEEQAEIPFEDCLSRIHVLNLCSDTLYNQKNPSPTRGLPRRLTPILAAIKGKPQYTAWQENRHTWDEIASAIDRTRPVLVIINSVPLNRPVPAHEIITSVGRMAGLFEGKDLAKQLPGPGVLLVAHSKLGAYRSNEPMAYESPDAPWTSALTLAYARTKKRRVLRIVHASHGASRISMQLTSLTPGKGPEPVLGFIEGESWVRGPYGTIRQRRAPKQANGKAQPDSGGDRPDASPPNSGADTAPALDLQDGQDTSAESARP